MSTFDPTPANRSGALLLLCAAQLLVVLDLSIVNVALPAIQEDLGTAAETLHWVVSGYALTFGGFLLLGGRAADLFGRRRILLVGLAAFTLASLLGGLAPNIEVLITARAAQGVAAALASPAALALITTISSDEAGRRRALSVFAAVGSAAFAVGVVLGGTLTATLGWRWVLFVNVPIGAVALALGPRWLTEHRAAGARRLDLPGAVTATAGLLALISGLSRAETHGWVAPLTLALLTAAVLLLGTFVLVEQRSPEPLVPLRLLGMRAPAGADAVMFLASAAFFPVFLLVSQHLQQVIGLDPLAAGLAFLPMALTVTACSGYVSGRLSAAAGSRFVVTAGMLVMALGLVLLARGATTGSFLVGVLPGTLVVAIGIGTAFTAVLAAATEQVPDTDRGAASGLVSTAQQVGGAVGVAVLVALAAPPHGVDATPAVLVAGDQRAYGAAIALVLAAAVVAWLTLRPGSAVTRRLADV